MSDVALCFTVMPNFLAIASILVSTVQHTLGHVARQRKDSTTRYGPGLYPQQWVDMKSKSETTRADDNLQVASRGDALFRCSLTEENGMFAFWSA